MFEVCSNIFVAWDFTCACSGFLELAQEHKIPFELLRNILYGPFISVYMEMRTEHSQHRASVKQWVGREILRCLLDSENWDCRDFELWDSELWDCQVLWFCELSFHIFEQWECWGVRVLTFRNASSAFWDLTPGH